ncbi:MAG TPA: hypothetical protein VH458_07065 [Vicinamibacterales bacterium]|jgi:hypothetical protein
MHNCLRAGLLVLLVWLSAARAVRAESITYRFEGQVETTTGMVPPSVGDIVSGIVTFEVPGIEAPPGAAAGIFQTRKDIYQLSFAHEPGAAPFHSRTLNNQQLTVQVSNNFFGDIGGPFDELDVVLSTLTSPQLGFTIDLIDPTGTVYTNGNLPISPDLEAFALRHFVGSITEGRAIIGTLGGTITSLTGEPGPSITPEPGSVLLLGPPALSLLGAARMKKRRKRPNHEKCSLTANVILGTCSVDRGWCAEHRG